MLRFRFLALLSCVALGCAGPQHPSSAISRPFAAIADPHATREQLADAYCAIAKLEVDENAELWISAANDTSLPICNREVAQALFFDRFVETPIGLRALCAKYPISSWFESDMIVNCTHDEVTPFDSVAERRAGEIYLLRIQSKDGDDCPIATWLRITPPGRDADIAAVARGTSQGEFSIDEISVPSPSRSELGTQHTAVKGGK